MYRWFEREPRLSFAPFDQWKLGLEKSDAESSWGHIMRSSCVSIEKSRQHLGYSPRFSSLEAIQQSVAALIASAGSPCRRMKLKQRAAKQWRAKNWAQLWYRRPARLGSVPRNALLVTRKPETLKGKKLPREEGRLEPRFEMLSSKLFFRLAQHDAQIGRTISKGWSEHKMFDRLSQVMRDSFRYGGVYWFGIPPRGDITFASRESDIDKLAATVWVGKSREGVFFFKTSICFFAFYAQQAIV